ncbi:toll/interleukin-1 receptor domain-containing protein [Endothiovibrio diazotrophicus]
MENGAYTYRAFISYRQCSPDREWARGLHRMLEGYRTPRGLVRSGVPRRLGKVFLDSAELAAAADLGAEIRAALDASQFLIVVCSPRAARSRWINEEVRYFQSIGRGDRVLPVLIEGEPGEALPEALARGREPLAADLRERGERRSRRRRLRDARLRLLAPILGCVYDDLLRRDQVRFVRLLASGAVVGLVLAATLAGLLWRQVQTTRELEQAIFETSVIYTQYFLAINDDYDKWARASGKLIDIVDQRDVARARKANELLAKYVALKGYALKPMPVVYPFYEDPRYLLKSLFQRRAKFTVGQFELSAFSTLLLDDLQFPAKLFRFLASPPIPLPASYQRMEQAPPRLLGRYAGLYEAISRELAGDRAGSLRAMARAAEDGLFHAVSDNLSTFDLCNIQHALALLAGERDESAADWDENSRAMDEHERWNLIRHLNAYYLVELRLPTSSPRIVVNSGVPDTGFDEMVWNADFQQRRWSEGGGPVRFGEIASLLRRRLEGLPDADPLHAIPGQLTALEEEARTEWNETLKPSRDAILAETQRKLEALLAEAGVEMPQGARERVDVPRDETPPPFAQPEVIDIDDLIDALPEEARERLRERMGLPETVGDQGSEIRVAIAQGIRPYAALRVAYDLFVTHPAVVKVLSDDEDTPPSLAAMAYRAALVGECDAAARLSARAMEHYRVMGGGVDGIVLPFTTRCGGSVTGSGPVVR